MLTDPTAFIADKRMLLDLTQKNLAAVAEKQLAGHRQRYAALCAALDALSPLKVLARGYAVARTADGTIIKNAADVHKGDRIDLTIEKGRLGCVVETQESGGKDHG